MAFVWHGKTLRDRMVHGGFSVGLWSVGTEAGTEGMCRRLSPRSTTAGGARGGDQEAENGKRETGGETEPHSHHWKLFGGARTDKGNDHMALCSCTNVVRAHEKSHRLNNRWRVVFDVVWCYLCQPNAMKRGMRTSPKMKPSNAADHLMSFMFHSPRN